MTEYTTERIRSLFLDYFERQGHQKVASSSLVPAQDPTLLFTNAGMVQFKDTFLGIDDRAYTAATSAQRCVRAGGKHNDLENVGYTKRHHTFFEMLGNFSFGAYFKEEAISYAWTFLTEVLSLPADRLWVTVYKDDKETESIWLDHIRIDPARMSRCGDKDNFWQMGDTGPCGPCTEIFFDHGPDVPGGPPGSPQEDGDRYVEIWNLVFMQYDRNAKGDLLPLPQPCVDTGMGLERIAAVMQQVTDNYDIDLFKQLLQGLSAIIPTADVNSTSMRVIVDHIRSIAFLIADGVSPSNEGRGYVLRRIIRRAVRHGVKLQQDQPFLYKLVDVLVAVMGAAYPVLKQQQSLIEKVVEQEEVQFSKTLSRGLKILDDALLDHPTGSLPGPVVFQLYDTYGFPVDLTADVARERGRTIDRAGFDAAMQGQREQSQRHQQFSVDKTKRLHLNYQTTFVGYEKSVVQASVQTMIEESLNPVSVLTVGQKGALVLDVTPFYAESGGQVGDVGVISYDDAVFEVINTTAVGATVLHWGVVRSGQFSGDIQVTAAISEERRAATARNHSATHLLHAALQQVLGQHVQQKGSLVDSDKLRFDFSHHSALTHQDLADVEALVQAQICANHSAELSLMTPEDAKASGAMALFNERYSAEVRVLRFGDFSLEICGGTHVRATGEIGAFVLVQEGACAAGVRRIEAYTGERARAYNFSMRERLMSLSAALKSDLNNVNNKLEDVLNLNYSLKRRVQQAEQQLLQQSYSDLYKESLTLGDVHVLVKALGDVDRETLRITLDQLKSRFKKYAVMLAGTSDGKALLLASVSSSCTSVISAREWLAVVTDKIDGRGGGKPEMAQGGGNDVAGLAAALDAARSWVEQKLL